MSVLVAYIAKYQKLLNARAKNFGRNWNYPLLSKTRRLGATKRTHVSTRLAQFEHKLGFENISVPSSPALGVEVVL